MTPPLLPLASLLFACLLSSLSQATIYQWTDPNGKVHYSDQPRAGATEIHPDLSINVIASPKRSLPPARSKNTVKTAYQLALLSPRDQATLRANNGQLPIKLSLQPPLESSQQIQILLNGKVVKTLQQAGAITLDGIDRGEHQLQAQVIDKSGKVLALTDPITLFMHRHSRLISAKPSN